MTTALLAVLLALTPPPADLDARLLAAIHQCENGPIGNRGNLSPAAQHDNRDDAGHLRWIKETLLANGYVPTPHLIALVWVAGFDRVRLRQETKAQLDYAKRVTALFMEANK